MHVCGDARALQRRRRSRPRREPCRHRARRTSGHRRGRRRAPASHRARPRCGRGARLRAAAGASASSSPAPCASTSVALPSQRTKHRRVVPQHRRGSVDVRRRFGRREPLRDLRARAAPQRHLREDAERAERPDHQARQVVAGHVLHRRPAAFHDSSVAGDEAHLEHLIADRAVSEPAHARQPGSRAHRRRSRRCHVGRARTPARGRPGRARSRRRECPRPR